MKRVLLFTSRAKMGEIFLESIPQFLTQLAMTSAKGQEGLKQLSSLQMVSVATSVIAIALGVSQYVIDGKKDFMSLHHRSV